MSHVFLTGASGTIGSALVPRLLADPAQQVTLLLRAADSADDTRRYSGLSGTAFRPVSDAPRATRSATARRSRFTSGCSGVFTR